MSETMYHYLWQNQQVGPVPEGELRRYLAERRLPPDVFVWTPGMAQWAPALQVAALQAGGAPTPVAPPPAPQAAGVQVAAQPAQSANFQGALSPSEVLFFHAERFASKAGALTASVALVGSEQKVKAEELGQAIMAVAFLALEHAGAVSLTIGEEKGLFGLGKKKVMTVLPASGAAPWGPDCLEGAIVGLLRQGPLTVSEVIYRLLRQDYSVPAAVPYYLLRDGLVRKGLIIEQQQKGFLGSISYHHFLTDLARQAAAAHDPMPWLQFLGQTQQTRLELWAALTAGIQSGFVRRREVDTSSDTGSDFSND